MHSAKKVALDERHSTRAWLLQVVGCSQAWLVSPSILSAQHVLKLGRVLSLDTYCQLFKQVVFEFSMKKWSSLEHSNLQNLGGVLPALKQSLFFFFKGQNYRNVIMWMDHRAVSQVDRINATKHRVLSYIGGVMSVEMQPPKLLWIKEVSTSKIVMYF